MLLNRIYSSAFTCPYRGYTKVTSLLSCYEPDGFGASFTFNNLETLQWI